jgi:microcystin-dependent protein
LTHSTDPDIEFKYILIVILFFFELSSKLVTRSLTRSNLKEGRMKLFNIIIAAATMTLISTSEAGPLKVKGSGFQAPTISDVANVYNPQPGEIVYDQSASGFYGYDHLGAWVQLSAPTSASVPTGTVTAFAGSTAPSGYLLCDGQAISRTTYSTLFTEIGTTYGAGDGSTTFNLPDLRGIFVRGAGSQTIESVTYSGTLGTTQGQATALPTTPFTTNTAGAHSHDMNERTDIAVGGATGVAIGTRPGNLRSNNMETAGAHSHTITGGGDAETRPANLSLNYIIKY